MRISSAVAERTLNHFEMFWRCPSFLATHTNIVVDRHRMAPAVGVRLQTALRGARFASPLKLPMPGHAKHRDRPSIQILPLDDSLINLFLRGIPSLCVLKTSQNVAPVYLPIYAGVEFIECRECVGDPRGGPRSTRNVTLRGTLGIQLLITERANSLLHDVTEAHARELYNDIIETAGTPGAALKDDSRSFRPSPILPLLPLVGRGTLRHDNRQNARFASSDVDVIYMSKEGRLQLFIVKTPSSGLTTGWSIFVRLRCPADLVRPTYPLTENPSRN